MVRSLKVLWFLVILGFGAADYNNNQMPDFSNGCLVNSEYNGRSMVLSPLICYRMWAAKMGDRSYVELVNNYQQNEQFEIQNQQRNPVSVGSRANNLAFTNPCRHMTGLGEIDCREQIQEQPPVQTSGLAGCNQGSSQCYNPQQEMPQLTTLQYGSPQNEPQVSDEQRSESGFICGRFPPATARFFGCPPPQQGPPPCPQGPQLSEVPLMDLTKGQTNGVIHADRSAKETTSPPSYNLVLIKLRSKLSGPEDEDPKFSIVQL